MAFRLGDARIDPETATVTRGSEIHRLTPLENKLLVYLADRTERLVPREELMMEVWGYRPGIRSRALDSTVIRLRAKLEPAPDEPRHLLVVYGQGVRLAGVVAEGFLAAPRGGPFFGRRAELDVLEAAASNPPGSRAAAILGPPGVGKSRLAREYASHSGRGSVIAELSAARSDHDVDSAVARALGLGGVGDPSSLVPAALSAREGGVIVLDGCEGAPTAVASRLDAWLAAAPGVFFVATSRVPLPAHVARVHLAGLEPSAATALFVNRARAASASFRADADLEALLERLDRLPLAIELVAARADVLNVREMLGQLDGGAEEPLCSAFDAALALATPRDRALLSALTVFETPFSPAAVASLSGLELRDALDAIHRLLERGLLWLASGANDPETRFALFAVVRERVGATVPVPALAALRHAAWFGRLGVLDDPSDDPAICAAVPELREGLARMEAQCESPEHRSAAIACGLALIRVAMVQGPLAEGLAVQRRLERLLAASDPEWPLFCRRAAWLAKFRGQTADGLAWTDRALQAPLTIDEQVTIRSLRSLFRQQSGDTAGSAAELDAVATIAPQAGLAYARYLQRRAQHLPDAVAAESVLLEAARISGEAGSPRSEGGSYSVLGHAFMWFADWTRARGYLERADEILGGHPALTRAHSVVVTFLGMLFAREGDLERADETLAEALFLQRRVGNRETEFLTRIEQARVERARGRAAQSAAALRSVVVDPTLDPRSWNAVCAYLALAEAELSGGRMAPARAAARQGLVAAETCGSEYEHGALLHLLALTDATDGRADAARSALAEADASACYPIGVVRAGAFRAMIAHRLGEHDAAERLRPAYDLAERLGMTDRSTELSWVRMAEQDLAVGLRLVREQ